MLINKVFSKFKTGNNIERRKKFFFSILNFFCEVHDDTIALNIGDLLKYPH